MSKAARYDGFMLAELRGRHPGRLSDAMLALVSRGDVWAKSMVERRSGVDIDIHLGMVRIRLQDRSAVWQGAALRIPGDMPDTLLATMEGRTVDQIVDVRVGGSLRISHAHTVPGVTWLTCHAAACDPPRTSRPALLLARIVVAAAFALCYARMIAKEVRDREFERSMHAFTIVAGALLAIVYGVCKDDADPRTIILSLLMTTLLPGIMLLWPPRDWRWSITTRLRGGRPVPGI